MQQLADDMKDHKESDTNNSNSKQKETRQKKKKNQNLESYTNYQGCHNIVGFNYSKIDDLSIYCIIMYGYNH